MSKGKFDLYGITKDKVITKSGSESYVTRHVYINTFDSEEKCEECIESMTSDYYEEFYIQYVLC